MNEISKDRDYFRRKSNYNNNKDFYDILHLQSSILNNHRLRKIETKKIVNRILRYTSKEKDNNLLINQINDYRIKKEMIAEKELKEMRKRNPDSKSPLEKKFMWLSSLREYQKGVDNKSQNIDVNANKRKNQNQTISMATTSDQFFLKTNYYSFYRRDNVYEFEGNDPLFARKADKNEENEKIRDTLGESINNLKLMKNRNKFLKSGVNNSLYNNRLNRINYFRWLNIKGKKLLEFEMELSKELEGKKKNIVIIPYNEEDIENKVFAKSYSVNNFYAPKAVKNACELHCKKVSK